MKILSFGEGCGLMIVWRSTVERGDFRAETLREEKCGWRNGLGLMGGRA